MLRPRFVLLRRCITVQYGILQYSTPYRIVHHNHRGHYSYNYSSAHSLTTLRNTKERTMSPKKIIIDTDPV